MSNHCGAGGIMQLAERLLPIHEVYFPVSCKLGCWCTQQGRLRIALQMVASAKEKERLAEGLGLVSCRDNRKHSPCTCRSVYLGESSCIANTLSHILPQPGCPGEDSFHRAHSQMCAGGLYSRGGAPAGIPPAHHPFFWPLCGRPDHVVDTLSNCAQPCVQAAVSRGARVWQVLRVRPRSRHTCAAAGPAS